MPIVNRLTRAAQLLGAAAIALMVLVSMLGALSRYVFHGSDAWIAEVERYLLLVSVFAVSGSAYLDGDHVRADMLMRLLPARAHTAMNGAVDLLGLGFCGFMLWQGTTQALKLSEAHLRSATALQTPLALVAMLLPLSMLLLGIAFAYHLMRTLRAGPAA